MGDGQEWAAPNQTQQLQAAAGTKPFKNIFSPPFFPFPHEF